MNTGVRDFKTGQSSVRPGYRGSDQRTLGTRRFRKVVNSEPLKVPETSEGSKAMILLRHQIGDVLRDVRQRQGRTLREVSSGAKVSLGYLSEIERGQKEASSELLAKVSEALDVPLSVILREVSVRIAVEEALTISDVLSDDVTSLAGLQRRGVLAGV